MKCAICNGSGAFPYSKDVCPVCKGRGQLPDSRVNNPPCPLCKATGAFPYSKDICPTCEGWGRLPNDPTTEDVPLNIVESEILRILQSMLPSAAASYQQAILDFRDGSRRSMRGTAVELREALREVLDHLAPDGEVTGMPGFKLEPGQARPTMRQKARFVLRSRGYSDATTKAPEDAAAVVEELVAALVRSVYQAGAFTTHIASAQTRVKQLKMYVETVLAELLGVHEAPNKGMEPTR